MNYRLLAIVSIRTYIPLSRIIFISTKIIMKVDFVFIQSMYQILVAYSSIRLVLCLQSRSKEGTSCGLYNIVPSSA